MPKAYEGMMRRQRGVEDEYRKLNKEYHNRFGKWFKRNSAEMQRGISKLEAIKLRLKGEGIEHEPETDDFNLGGAL